MLDEAGLHLQDTTSSPMKSPKEESIGPAKPSAQKQLIMESVGTSGEKGIPPPPPQYVSPRDKKRMKRAAAKEAVTSPTKNKAGSREEDRRSQ
ncbi:hypothetical protein PAHAL_6G143200 [Panicum hallii]|jgi:hypothetical protein|uniref:Uncharacterized protein n=1 Tax=Panicum hallii TaxID=206008 RepID=A0A2T8IG89_9POAL|nr:hypothetical protein PAHAL_6G143200 [Panicum hallii]